MKKTLAVLAVIMLCLSLSGCRTLPAQAQIVATTLPVYEFTASLCKDTNISVSQLINENISCLHDYTLKVHQMQMLEKAEVVIISGAGLDAFIQDVVKNETLIIDASSHISFLSAEQHHAHSHEHDHNDVDPHIWLSPANAKVMADNIYSHLCDQYPEYAPVFTANLQQLNLKIDALYNYGSQALSTISNRDCITFHDGFAYLADAFDLHILHAIEEESGSEASAQEIVELISLIDTHGISAIFTEKNTVPSSATILHNEINIPVYELDMAISGNSYFDAMYHNIDTIKEALK